MHVAFTLLFYLLFSLMGLCLWHVSLSHIPMIAVSSPIMQMDTTKQAQPFQYSVGGTKAKRTFQNTVRKCIT